MKRLIPIKKINEDARNYEKSDNEVQGDEINDETKKECEKDDKNG